MPVEDTEVHRAEDLVVVLRCAVNHFRGVCDVLALNSGEVLGLESGLRVQHSLWDGVYVAEGPGGPVAHTQDPHGGQARR